MLVCSAQCLYELRCDTIMPCRRFVVTRVRAGRGLAEPSELKRSRSVLVYHRAYSTAYIRRTFHVNEGGHQCTARITRLYAIPHPIVNRYSKRACKGIRNWALITIVIPLLPQQSIPSTRLERAKSLLSLRAPLMAATPSTRAPHSALPVSTSPRRLREWHLLPLMRHTPPEETSLFAV